MKMILIVLSIAFTVTTIANAQQPQVTDAVTGFLSDKSKILPLQTSDKAAYTSKFSSLFCGLKTKLSGIF